MHNQWSALSAENYKDENNNLFSPFNAKGKFD